MRRPAAREHHWAADRATQQAAGARHSAGETKMSSCPYVAQRARDSVRDGRLIGRFRVARALPRARARARRPAGPPRRRAAGPSQCDSECVCVTVPLIQCGITGSISTILLEQKVVVDPFSSHTYICTCIRIHIYLLHVHIIMPYVSSAHHWSSPVPAVVACARAGLRCWT